MEEKHSLVYGTHKLAYVLERKRVKNINVHVRRDGTIYASAPYRTELALVEQLLRDHATRLLDCVRQRQLIQQHEASGEKYAEGAAFCYLGNRLQIKLSRGMAQVRYDGNYLYLTLPNPESITARQKLMDAFLREAGQRIFSERMAQLYPWFQLQGVAWPALRLSKMKSRWGTCNKSRGLVTLSLRLLAHPYSSIDYVILHELCHFIYFDHSARFHALMTKLMPDWKERKQVLEAWSRLVSLS